MAPNDNEDDMNLDQPATRRDIQGLREEVDRRFEDLHRHIDVSIEAFKSEFANLMSRRSN